MKRAGVGVEKETVAKEHSIRICDARIVLARVEIIEAMARLIELDSVSTVQQHGFLLKLAEELRQLAWSVQDCNMLQWADTPMVMAAVTRFKPTFRKLSIDYASYIENEVRDILSALFKRATTEGW